MPSLTFDEARTRSAQVSVTSYDVDLDLTGPETFASTTTLVFDAADGAETFVDLKAVSVDEVTLNGEPVDLAHWHDERLTLTGLAVHNTLVVRATMAFRNDGQGLHRFVDPGDGAAYVYGHLFIDNAPRVFACFDQPDLKAPYTLHVTAPGEWTVYANGRGTATGPGRWEFAPTRPLSTYFVTLCAGPWASVFDEHVGIPLGIHARASMAAQLDAQAPEMLDVTKRAFDAYHELFGIRYPFGDYHQVFVPEFNAGAMENPGCVTIADVLLYRGQATDTERLVRATTLVHEMAHMWFGDLVTMRWWGDLWLNESFAEYMSYRVTSASTAFRDAWVHFTVARKTWGYAAERTPSTHPVAGGVPKDALSALQDFDGISYAKGASVLQQLVAYLGDDAFLAGIRDHLTRYSYGNADLADFLAAMSRASGRDVPGWAEQWLTTSGVDTLEVDLTEADGIVTQATLRRTPPADKPADRPHALDVAAYDGGDLVARDWLVIDSPERDVPALVGKVVPPLVVANAGSQSWATVRLPAPQHVAGELAAVPDPVTRAVVWSALLDGLVDAVIDPRVLTDVVAEAWPRETDDALLSVVNTRLIPMLLRRYLPPDERAAATDRIIDAAQRLRDAHEAGSSAYLTATRRLLASSRDLDWLRAVVAGSGLDGALASDLDLRWLALRNMARSGAASEADIDALAATDPSHTGRLAALSARAALPTAEAKSRAWSTAVGPTGSNYERVALLDGFWDVTGDSVELVRPYVGRYTTDLPALVGVVGDDALSRVSFSGFPRVMVEDATEVTLRPMLETDLSAAVRREVVDGLAELGHALASRRAFPAAG